MPADIPPFFSGKFVAEQEISDISFFKYVLHEVCGHDFEERYGKVLAKRKKRLSHAKLSTEPNRVCIPTEMVPPRGLFIDLLTDISYQQAFLVALFGQRNPFVCSSCRQTWESTRISPKHEHVLFPFHNCTSLKGVADQTCGNCIAQGRTCTWASFRNIRAFMELADKSNNL